MNIIPFKGLCLLQLDHDDTLLWSKCHEVDKEGLVDYAEDHANLLPITHGKETTTQALGKMAKCALSACQIRTFDGGLVSGVWIRGQNRDLVLTVGHFLREGSTFHDHKQRAKPAIVRTEPNIIAGMARGVKCFLVAEFQSKADSTTKYDIAIFAPCSPNGRSDRQALDLEVLQPDMSITTDTGPAICYGYNGPIPEKHIAKQSSCACSVCFQDAATALMKQQRDRTGYSGDFYPLPDPEHAFWPNRRIISVGRWTEPWGSSAPTHTISGWYGISGSPIFQRMLSPDPTAEPTTKCIALFQRGEAHPNAEKNGAITIPQFVINRLRELGDMVSERMYRDNE